MSNVEFKCPQENCNVEYDNLQSLCRHWTRTHFLDTKTLWLLLNHLEQEPLCACGCKATTKFLDAGRGYAAYIRGHASRVSNNFQTKKSVAKSKATRKQMHKEGKIKIWNSGLTKETDQRLEDLGNKTREWLEKYPEERIKKSERMKRQRRDGTTVAPSGSKSGMWKGGISPLSSVCHSNKKFYHGWKYPILCKAKFACENCGAFGNSSLLEVHHDKEQMCDIIRSVSKQLHWEELVTVNLKANDPALYEKKQEISDAVADYHIANNVSGVVMCKSCHKDLHGSHNL